MRQTFLCALVALGCGTVTAPPPVACTSDADCDDGLYCNGQATCVAHRCQDGPVPCTDAFACTTDTCDEASHVCQFEPDDTRCDDHNVCSGTERCRPQAPGANPVNGCLYAPPDPCLEDLDPCVVATCDPVLGCQHLPLDIDGDGHVNDQCAATASSLGDDCNDYLAAVHPGATEICNDGIDNDCNGLTDAWDTHACTAQNDTCDTATPFMADGFTRLEVSTIGLADDYALPCHPGSYPDAVFELTLSSTSDIALSQYTTMFREFGLPAAFALASSCDPLELIGCVVAPGTTAAPLVMHSVPAGTYRLIVETETPGLSHGYISVQAPTMIPVGDRCPRSGDAVIDLADGTTHGFLMGEMADDYALGGCDAPTGWWTRDAVMRLTLTSASDVWFDFDGSDETAWFIAGLSTSCGEPPLLLHHQHLIADPGTAIDPSATVRNLPAGTYWLMVDVQGTGVATDHVISVRAHVDAPAGEPSYRVAESSNTFGDACAAPGAIITSGLPEDFSVRVAASEVPFALSFYGQPPDAVGGVPGFWIGEAGYLSFVASGNSGLSLPPFALPHHRVPVASIVPYATWLRQRPESRICYATTGDAPERQLVVQWDDFWIVDLPSAHLTFQAVIHEAASGDNAIDIAYVRMDGALCTPAVGVQNWDATEASSIARPPRAPSAFHFTPVD